MKDDWDRVALWLDRVDDIIFWSTQSIYGPAIEVTFVHPDGDTYSMAYITPKGAQLSDTAKVPDGEQEYIKTAVALIAIEWYGADGLIGLQKT